MWVCFMKVAAWLDAECYPTSHCYASASTDLVRPLSVSTGTAECLQDSNCQFCIIRIGFQTCILSYR